MIYDYLCIIFKYIYIYGPGLRPGNLPPGWYGPPGRLPPGKPATDGGPPPDSPAPCNVASSVCASTREDLLT